MIIDNSSHLPPPVFEINSEWGVEVLPSRRYSYYSCALLLNSLICILRPTSLLIFHPPTLVSPHEQQRKKKDCPLDQPTNLCMGYQHSFNGIIVIACEHLFHSREISLHPPSRLSSSALITSNLGIKRAQCDGEGLERRHGPLHVHGELVFTNSTKLTGAQTAR
jgi:hypothetical protein